MLAVFIIIEYNENKINNTSTYGYTKALQEQYYFYPFSFLKGFQT